MTCLPGRLFRQVMLPSLSPGERYTVRVAAETAQGTGPPSAPLVFSLPAPAPAAPPAGLLDRRWFQAALAALLSLLLLLTAALLLCLYRRRRSRALSRGEAAQQGASQGRDRHSTALKWRYRFQCRKCFACMSNRIFIRRTFQKNYHVSTGDVKLKPMAQVSRSNVDRTGFC